MERHAYLQFLHAQAVEDARNLMAAPPPRSISARQCVHELVQRACRCLGTSLDVRMNHACVETERGLVGLNQGPKRAAWLWVCWVTPRSNAATSKCVGLPFSEVDVWVAFTSWDFVFVYQGVCFFFLPAWMDRLAAVDSLLTGSNRSLSTCKLLSSS